MKNKVVFEKHILGWHFSLKYTKKIRQVLQNISPETSPFVYMFLLNVY